MPLHPQAEAARTEARESGGKPISAMTVAEARAAMQMVGGLSGAGPQVARVDDVTVPGPAREVPVRIYDPTPAGTGPAGVLVYLHGGGGVIGTVDDFDALHRVLAVESGLQVVAPDYALAPEAPHPAGLDEAWAVVLATAARLPGVPPIVMGDSSGGGLAAAVARRARDAGGPAIALQILVYPMVDTDLTTPSYEEFADAGYLNSRADMQWFLGHLAPDPQTHADPDLAPLRAPDLTGLTPAVVVTAEYDLVRDEGRAYADRLAAAGVPVETIHAADQMHAFLNLVNVFDAADEYAARLARRAAQAAAAAR